LGEGIRLLGSLGVLFCGVAAADGFAVCSGGEAALRRFESEDPVDVE